MIMPLRKANFLKATTGFTHIRMSKNHLWWIPLFSETSVFFFKGNSETCDLTIRSISETYVYTKELETC